MIVFLNYFLPQEFRHFKTQQLPFQFSFTCSFLRAPPRLPRRTNGERLSDRSSLFISRSAKVPLSIQIFTPSVGRTLFGSHLYATSSSDRPGENTRVKRKKSFFNLERVRKTRKSFPSLENTARSLSGRSPCSSRASPSAFSAAEYSACGRGRRTLPRTIGSRGGPSTTCARRST
jgi:hypothetical protein